MPKVYCVEAIDKKNDLVHAINEDYKKVTLKLSEVKFVDFNRMYCIVKPGNKS
jgi:hypothetical protein